MIHLQKSKNYFYLPTKCKIRKMLESYGLMCDSTEKIKLLSELKLYITNVETLSQFERFLIGGFALETLAICSLNEQRRLFLNMAANFVKKIETTEELDTFSNQMANIIDDNEKKTLICIQFITEIIRVMQEHPYSKLQNYFINHKLNDYLTLANIVINRYVMLKTDQQDQQEYIVNGGLDYIQAAISLIHEILTYDYGFQQRDLETHQFQFERSPLILPTKHSRYAKFNQFESTICSNAQLTIYETIFFNSNIKIQRLIIELLTDLSRIHLKFFKTRNNYRIFISNVLSVCSLIMTRIQLNSYEHYCLCLQLGITFNAIITTNILFDISKETRFMFYQCIEKYIYQVFEKGLINTQLLTQYWRFIIAIQQKSHFNPDTTYNQEIMLLINRIGRQYEINITQVIIQPTIIIHPTFKEQISNPNPQNVKSLLQIFKLCKPKCSPIGYFPACINFQYWLNVYLSKYSITQVKTKAANRLINIFQFINEQQKGDMKNIFIYILSKITQPELRLNLVTFINDIGYNWQQFIHQSLKCGDQTVDDYIYQLVHRLKQQNSSFSKSQNILCEQILGIIKSPNTRKQRKLKFYQIVYLMQLQVKSNLQEKSKQNLNERQFLMCVNACFNNKLKFKYDEVVQSQYQKAKLKFLPYLRQKQTLLNSQELTLTYTMLSVQNIQNKFNKKLIFMEICNPINKSLQMYLAKFSTKYLISCQAALIFIINLLLQFGDNVKSIRDQVQYGKLLSFGSQLITLIKYKQVKGYLFLQKSILELIKCLHNCLQKQSLIITTHQNLVKITNCTIQLWINLLTNYNEQLIKLIWIQYGDQQHIKYLIKYICQVLEIDLNNIWKFHDLISKLYRLQRENCSKNIQNWQILKYFEWCSEIESQEQLKNRIKKHKQSQQQKQLQQSISFKTSCKSYNIEDISQSFQYKYQ